MSDQLQCVSCGGSCGIRGVCDACYVDPEKNECTRCFKKMFVAYPCVCGACLDTSAKPPLTLGGVERVLMSDRMSRAHDYDISDGAIKNLGIWREHLVQLMTQLPGWTAKLVRRGGVDDDWLRVDLVSDGA